MTYPKNYDRQATGAAAHCIESTTASRYAFILGSSVYAANSVVVHPFNESQQTREIARRIAAARPDVVGLSMQFQHRAAEFVPKPTLLIAMVLKGHDLHGMYIGPHVDAWSAAAGSPAVWSSAYRSRVIGSVPPMPVAAEPQQEGFVPRATACAA